MGDNSNRIRINKRLRPLSWLYGLGVGFRNWLFDMGVLRSRGFDILVISVGNITVGGTGKTPHTEFLVKTLLGKYYNVAVISRGYKRKTHGFQLADSESTADSIGDEPMQMKTKFPDATVAVDKDRCHAINLLTGLNKGIDAIVLDDAFQHRYVKPGISILLVDYHRPIVNDELLPSGRLREPARGKGRADIIIITKCPKDLRLTDYGAIAKSMKLLPHQKLYFTTLAYKPLRKVFGSEMRELSSLSNDENVLLLTGIASPSQIIAYLKPFTQNISTLTFADHHRFKHKDVELINEKFASVDNPKIIITTEKDATRLLTLAGLSPEVRANTYALPVEIRFLRNQEEAFVNDILAYISKGTATATH